MAALIDETAAAGDGSSGMSACQFEDVSYLFYVGSDLHIKGFQSLRNESGEPIEYQPVQVRVGGRYIITGRGQSTIAAVSYLNNGTREASANLPSF